MSESIEQSTRSHTSTLAHTNIDDQQSSSPIPPVFTTDELAACRDDSAALVNLLWEKQLLLPLSRSCLRCSTAMRGYTDHKYDLGWRVHCQRCDTDEGVKRGSIFEHFRTPVPVLCELIREFEARVTVVQASRLTGVADKTISKLWKLIRQRMTSYNDSHPITYGPGDVVEIDEMYMKPLLETNEEDSDERTWHPIIGLIARESGLAALHICETHSTEHIRPVILPHLPSPLTTVITDQHASFIFLKDHVHHLWCIKEHRGAAVYPVVRTEDTEVLETVHVHTNTIEGFWSQVRRYVHASHGWTADYLPLILNEFQFWSRRISLATILQV